MNTWRNFTIATALAIAAATTFLLLPPRAVSSTTAQPAESVDGPTPGMSERFFEEKQRAVEQPLPAQF